MHTSAFREDHLAYQRTRSEQMGQQRVPTLARAAATRLGRRCLNYLSVAGNSRASTSLVEAWISVPDDCTSPPTRRSLLPMTPAARPCLLTGIDGMTAQVLLAGS